MSFGSACDHPGASALDRDMPLTAWSDSVHHTSFQENFWQAGRPQHKSKERHRNSHDFFGVPRVQQTLRAPGTTSSHAGLGRSLPRCDTLPLDLQGSSRIRHAQVWVDDEFRDSPEAFSEPNLSLEVPRFARLLPADNILSTVHPEASAASSSESDDEFGSDDKENLHPTLVGPFQPCNRGRALREVQVVESPMDDLDDLEDSEMDLDFDSENLAEKLQERVRRNTGGFYEFQIYSDPTDSMEV